MADKKLTDAGIATTTSPLVTDLLYVVTDPSGTPASKKTAIDNLPTPAATVTALAGKAASSHTHAESDVTNLTTDLAAKAPLASPTFTGTVAGITASMVGAPSGSGTSSGTNTGDQTLPTNAAGTDLDTATDTTKFATAKAIKDAHNVPSVAPGTSGNVLTSDGTDWTSATPAGGGGGQTLVTKVVAPSGGDYTTLGAAIAAASNGWSIAVAPGTYTESAITSALTNISVFGTDPEATVLSFGANSLTMSGTRFRMKNVKILMTTGGLVSSGTYAEAFNCHFNKTGGGGNVFLDFQASNASFQGNSIVSTGSNTNNFAQFGGLYDVVNGNQWEWSIGGGLGIDFSGGYATSTGNHFRITTGNASNYGIRVSGDNTTFTGNVVRVPVAASSIVLLGSSVNNVVSANQITGGAGGVGIDISNGANDNTISGNRVAMTSASAIAVSVAGQDNTVTGNQLTANSTTSTVGIKVTNVAGSDNNTITGNCTRNFATGISVVGSTTNNTVIVGNNTIGSTTGISDSGTTSTVASNA